VVFSLSYGLIFIIYYDLDEFRLRSVDGTSLVWGCRAAPIQSDVTTNHGSRANVGLMAVAGYIFPADEI
jgi:hypothetical protein